MRKRSMARGYRPGSATPGKQGVRSKSPVRACEFIMETKLHIDNLLIIRHDHLWWRQSPDVYMARGRGGQII